MLKALIKKTSTIKSIIAHSDDQRLMVQGFLGAISECNDESAQTQFNTTGHPEIAAKYTLNYDYFIITILIWHRFF